MSKRPQESTNAAATPEPATPAPVEATETPFVMPTGFHRTESDVTVKLASGEKYSYKIEYVQPDTDGLTGEQILANIQAEYTRRGIADGALMIADAWAELQATRAKSGGVAAVKSAENDADRAVAASKHGSNALRFFLWGKAKGEKKEHKARVKIAGLTAKQRQQFGEATLTLMREKGIPSAEDFQKLAYTLGVRGATNFAELRVPEPTPEQCTAWDAELAAANPTPVAPEANA